MTNESNKDKINNIPILDVLSMLWYYENTHYVVQGDNIRMKDDKWKISDWWIWSKSKNRLYCRSGLKPWRFDWDIIWIVKWALGIDAWEAMSKLEEKFSISKTPFTKPKESALSWKWNKAGSLSSEQIAYFEGRWIECNEHILKNFKNYNWAISTAIKSEWWVIKAIQWRKIWDVDKKFRYQIEKDWDDWTGIFSYFPKPDSKVCFLVEGMTDFATIAQAWVNVIGLVSATAWIQYVKAFDKKYELFYIPDNDDSGHKSTEALDTADVRYSKYNLTDFAEWVEDLNDAWGIGKWCWLSITDFLKELYNWRERPPSNIDLAKRRAIENREMWRREIWEKTFDLATGWIIPWSLMVINGFTWEGKTTTLDWLIKKLTEVHAKKVAYCSLDDDIWKMLAMFLWRKFNKDWQKEVYPNVEKYVDEYGADKFDKFLLYDDVNTLQDFSELVSNEDIDVLVVDFIQDIEWLRWSSPKEKMIDASTWLYQIAKNKRCAVIALSQASMWETQKPVLQRNPNESFMIRAKADTFINVWVYGGKHKIAFVKNKYWSTKYKFTEHDTDWDEITGDIKIFKDFSTQWAWVF